MPEPSRELLIVQVEAALELGDLDAAQRMLERVESRFADEPTVIALRQRVDGLQPQPPPVSTTSSAPAAAPQSPAPPKAPEAPAAALFAPPPPLPDLPAPNPPAAAAPQAPPAAAVPQADIDAAIAQAQTEIRRANYDGALEILRRASAQAPESSSLRSLLEQTEKAAQRHRETVVRNQAMTQAAERISADLQVGAIDAARDSLDETVIRLGWDSRLEPLRDRIEKLDAEAQSQRTAAQIERARALFQARSYRDALGELEAVVKRQPDNAEALDLERQVRAELDRAEARRQRAMAIDQARAYIERLIEAGELEQGALKVQEATARLGAQPSFDQLAQRLAQGRTDREANRMLEWSKRRSKEAESLVREAGRLSLKGDFAAAMTRLEQARELNPNHPEIPGLLSAVTSGQERLERDRRRQEALQARRGAIQRQLDGLHLGAATAALKKAREEFGDDPSFAQLEIRLRQLREVQAGTRPDAATSQTGPISTAVLTRQQQLAGAYTWKQTFLFPFRGHALRVFGVLFLVLLVLELLAHLPAVGLAFAIARWLAPLAVAAFLLEASRTTVRGRNDLPPWMELGNSQRWASDLTLVLGTLALAAFPLLALLASRRLHGLLDADSSALGSLVLALLLWFAWAVYLALCGIAAIFGAHQGRQFGRHPSALRVTAPESAWTIHLFFGVTLAVVVVRLVATPLVPWLGTPVAVALEVYALLLMPHLLGVVIRRHGLELSRLYG